MEFNIGKSLNAKNNNATFTSTPDTTRKEENSLENGRTTKLYYQRFLNLESSLNMVIMINISLVVLYYEFDFKNSSGDYTSIVNTCLYLICVCTLIEIPMLINREYGKLELDYYQKNVYQISLWTSERMISLGFQILIFILQPYPFLNEFKFETSDDYDSITFDFKYNYLLTILSMLKLYSIFRAHLIRTDYMNPRSSRVCKMYLCKANYMFALKCMFTDYPNQLVGSAFSISLFIFAFALRVCQRELIHLPVPYNYSFDYILNAIWFTIITITTVGYGDYYPRTVIGRLVCTTLVVWGIFILSIMVMVLTNTFQMEQRQLKVLSLIKKLEKKEELRVAAINLINHVFKYKNKTKLKKEGRSKYTMKEKEEYQLKYKQFKKEFNSLRKEIESICEEDDVYQQMARQFQCLDDDLKSLNRNQQKLMDFIHDRIQNNENKL